MYRVDGRRLFIMPGVPHELRGIFTEELAPQFLTGRRARVVRELKFTMAVEARFYPVMRELETSHPDVSVGSYPSTQVRELVIRFSGEDEKRVLEAMEIVRQRVAPMGLTPMA
jgi:molybdopterin-biosynthesis enzyme MoeA-like protein